MLKITTVDADHILFGKCNQFLTITKGLHINKFKITICFCLKCSPKVLQQSASKLWELISWEVWRGRSRPASCRGPPPCERTWTGSQRPPRSPTGCPTRKQSHSEKKIINFLNYKEHYYWRRSNFKLGYNFELLKWLFLFFGIFIRLIKILNNS